MLPDFWNDSFEPQVLKATAGIAPEVTLVEVLDRVLDRGVMITGDLRITLANIDLLYVGLKVLITNADTADRLLAESRAEAETQATEIAAGRRADREAA